MSDQPQYTVDPDLSGRFNKIRMSPEAAEQSMKVSPLFFAYLQNKIAEYATAAIESKLEYDPDPTRQVKAILEHERLKNFVEILTELMDELVEANETKPTQPE